MRMDQRFRCSPVVGRSWDLALGTLENMGKAVRIIRPSSMAGMDAWHLEAVDISFPGYKSRVGFLILQMMTLPIASFLYFSFGLFSCMILRTKVLYID